MAQVSLLLLLTNVWNLISRFILIFLSLNNCKMKATFALSNFSNTTNQQPSCEPNVYPCNHDEITTIMPIF